MASPWAAAGLGFAVGSLFGRKKKRKRPEVIQPQLQVPYLSEQQILSHPMLSQLYQQWKQLAQTVSTTPPPTLPSGVIENLSHLAQSQPDITHTIATVGEMMRPLFEQELQRQLEMTHEQLARSLGTSSGGAIAEMLRRQIAEAERGWMAQLGQMGMQELQAQRGLMQWATEALPRMMTFQAQLPFLSYTLLSQATAPFLGTFTQGQVVPRAPTLMEQLLPVLLLGGIFS
jgi:hypothetical protein